MDMQNVSNLVIPEGEVRTVHDDNNRLLWGKVSYDVKYNGDTTQQTYSGKNLFKTISGGTLGLTGTANSDGTITVTGTSETTYAYIVSTFATSLPAGTYTFSVSKSLTHTITINCGGQRSITAGNTSITFTTTSTVTSLSVFVGTGGAGVSFNETFGMQLEAGSTATSFEKFVGGMASPNPDYPQLVNVVTGNQTITMSADGQQNQAFTVDLGSIELCKIGTYQDYIYKSGSDWYVHKTTGKIIYNGTENWQLRSGKSHTFQVSAPTTLRGGLSNYFTSIASVSFDVVPGIYLATTNNTIISYPDMADATAFETWLSTHNTVVYYGTTDATDTKITDATLVGQLNAVHEWLTRYGYNAAVTGNLPIIIDRTNL